MSECERKGMWGGCKFIPLYNELPLKTEVSVRGFTVSSADAREMSIRREVAFVYCARCGKKGEA